MKKRFGLMKVLLIILVFVAAGVIYSCSKTGAADKDADIYLRSDPVIRDTDEAIQQTEQESSDPVTVCVHVCGCVERPGVYYLPDGARVVDAVNEAGGLTADAASEYVNMAAFITDGSQLYIPSEDEITEPRLSQQEPSDDGLVDINRADKEELMTLPGIGSVKAEAIIEYRENISVFSEPEDLMQVDGIGQSIFDKLKNLIKVQ